MGPDVEERFIVLETKLAYQERLLEELNEVLIAKGREIDDLKRRMATSEEALRPQADAIRPPHEAPPHY